MAIADGDPRTLVPEFLSELTWLERNQTIRFYGLRHGSTGKNYPPDEAAASIARRAMVLGTYAGWLGVAVLPCIALVLWSSLAGPDLPALLGSEASIVAISVGLAAARHRQINRYFDENYPGSLDFRHGTAGNQ